jgi:hypothetical protein
MNVMTDIWTVFGRDRGQIVEVAYKYDQATDRIVRRRYDASDATTEYQSAPCPADVEWTGAEGVAPFNTAALDWEGLGGDRTAPETDTITIGDTEYYIGTDHLSIIDPTAPGLPDLADPECSPDEAIAADGHHEHYSHGDGEAVYRWYIGGDRWLTVDRADGDIASVDVTGDTIERHVLDWEHDCPDAEWLAEWELDYETSLKVVVDDGPCRIWVDVPFADTVWSGRPTSHYLRVGEYDGCGDSSIREFASRAEAADYIAANGQYAADDDLWIVAVD